jgi:hypothetical protein
MPSPTPSHWRHRTLGRVLAAAVVVLALGTVATLSANAQDIQNGPVLSVPIPDLRFSTLGVTNVNTSEELRGIPWIAEYVSAVYKFGIAIATLIAGVMLMLGGFMYLTAGGDAGRVSKAKQRITDALIGLGLVMGAYLILFTISEDFVTVRALRVKTVMTKDFNEMLVTYGFKNPDLEATTANESAAAQNTYAGSAAPVAAQSGEDVSLSDVNLSSGTAPEKMHRACSTPLPNDATYDQKIQNLVRVILAWKQVCVDQRGCAYYRGGFTALPSGQIAGTLLDLPYGIKTLTARNIEWSWPSDCADRWTTLQPIWYAFPEPGTYRDLAEFKQLVAEKKALYADFYSPSGHCYQAVANAYNENIAGAYERHGVYGGDCGTTLVQAYTCAGGKVAVPSSYGGPPTGAGSYTSGQRAAMGGEGSDVVVFQARNEAEMVQQIEEKGGMRFGDIINIGQANWQHNLMFTGGRDDVPFEVFEMGASGMDGTVGTSVDVGLGAPIGGVSIARKRDQPGEAFLAYMRAQERAKRAAGKSIYPVNIWRPYAYEPCASKSECSSGQACHCVATDCPRSQGSCIVTDKCGMALLCHRVNTGPILCIDDEDCAVGLSCVKRNEQATRGTCQGS